MLMARDQFAAKDIVDPRTGVEVLIRLFVAVPGRVVCLCEKPVARSGQRNRENLATTDPWLAGDLRSPRGPYWEQFSVNAHDVEANWLPCQVLAEAPW